MLEPSMLTGLWVGTCSENSRLTLLWLIGTKDRLSFRNWRFTTLQPTMQMQGTYLFRSLMWCLRLESCQKKKLRWVVPSILCKNLQPKLAGKNLLLQLVVTTGLGVAWSGMVWINPGIPSFSNQVTPSCWWPLVMVLRHCLPTTEGPHKLPDPKQKLKWMFKWIYA